MCISQWARAKVCARAMCSRWWSNGNIKNFNWPIVRFYFDQILFRRTIESEREREQDMKIKARTILTHKTIQTYIADMQTYPIIIIISIFFYCIAVFFLYSLHSQYV